MTEKSLDKWFDFPAGCYCGLVVKEATAKKLMKILYRQTQEIKEFLHQHKEDLATSNWTLVYPDGKQTIIKFTCTDTYDSVDNRIKLYDKTAGMEYIKDGLYVSTETYTKAVEEVKEKYYQITGTEPPKEDKL
jgi:hypothetical protein